MSQTAEERRAYMREYQRMYRARYPERGKAATDKWKLKHGATAVALANNHQVPIDVAKFILETKPAACDICHREMKLYYDHDHKTGHPRGWLCNRCNVALSLVEDAGLLSSALTYLEAA